MRLLKLWKHDRATSSLFNAWLYLAQNRCTPDDTSVLRIIWKALKEMEKTRESI